MGWNDHVDWEMESAVQDLVDEGLLVKGTAAYGIAQQAVYEGYESLTAEQRRTWRKYVGGPLSKRQRALEIQRVIDSNPE